MYRNIDKGWCFDLSSLQDRWVPLYFFWICMDIFLLALTSEIESSGYPWLPWYIYIQIRCGEQHYSLLAVPQAIYRKNQEGLLHITCIRKINIIQTCQKYSEWQFRANMNTDRSTSKYYYIYDHLNTFCKHLVPVNQSKFKCPHVECSGLAWQVHFPTLCQKHPTLSYCWKYNTKTCFYNVHVYTKFLHTFF